MNFDHDLPAATAGFSENYVADGIHAWLEKNREGGANEPMHGEDLGGNDAEPFVGMSRGNFDSLGGFLHQIGSGLVPGDGVDGTARSALNSLGSKLTELKNGGTGEEKAAGCSEDPERTLGKVSFVSNDERAAHVLPSPNLAGFRPETRQAEARAATIVKAMRGGGRTRHGEGVTTLVGGGVAVLGRQKGVSAMSLAPGHLKGVGGGGQHKAQATGRPPPQQTGGDPSLQPFLVCRIEGVMGWVQNTACMKELGGVVVQGAHPALGPAGQVLVRPLSNTQAVKGIARRGLQQGMASRPQVEGGDTKRGGVRDDSTGDRGLTTGSGATMSAGTPPRDMGDRWRGHPLCHLQYDREGRLSSLVLGHSRRATKGEVTGQVTVVRAHWLGVVLFLTATWAPRRGTKGYRHRGHMLTTHPQATLATTAALTKLKM